MVENKISEFENYSEALQLFKEIYLYNGYKKDIKKYATFSDSRSDADIFRNEAYSGCILADENGCSTWKILSPKNIFGIELEHIINHKKRNSITTKLVLNAGRFDLNRMMVRFAEIDVTNLVDTELVNLVESILGKTNEQLITEYEISENPHGILANAIILDTILANLKSENNQDFPKISCNAEDSSIILNTTNKEFKISNNSVEIGKQFIKYNTINEFPKCQFEIQCIKAKDPILSAVASKLTDFNSIENKKLDLSILGLALENENLKRQYELAKSLYSEYEKNFGKKEVFKDDRED